MSRFRLRGLLALAVVPLALLVPSAGAVSTTLVINEVDYDQPSTDTAEFLELKNVSSSAINLDAYAVELVNGTGGGAAIYQTIDLPATMLAAGDYYVICATTATTTNCDLDGGADTNLIQNGSPDAIGLRSGGALVDALSYEGNSGAPYTEGSGTGLDDNGAAATAEGLSRCADGSDTDQNADDFELRPSTPGAANDCGSTPPPVPPVKPIYELQGNGATSPFANTQQTTTGVVTAVLGGGIYLQDPSGDGNPATSDGIFAFTGNETARTLTPGDVVRVTGTLVEFRPSSGNSARPRDLTLTEFSPTTSVTKTGTALLPSPVTIENRPDVMIHPDGILTFEQLEGMRVSIPTPRVSGPTTDFGEFVVAAPADQANMAPGGNFLLHPLAGGGVDYNPERIMVDDEARVPGGTGSGVRINNPMVALTVGDTATGSIVGVLDYQFSNYRVQATHRVADVIVGSAPDAGTNLRDAAPFEGRIASFNVENLFDCVDAPGKADDHPSCNAAALAALETQLTKLAAGFESELEKPDIVIVEETENVEVLVGGDDGAGPVPGTTLTPLLDRVSGNWDAVSFDASDQRGIQVAFAYNTDRVTLHEAFLATDVLDDGGLFSGSDEIRPGREPLVGRFSIGDVDDVVIVGNHFKSKGGPQFGVDPLEAGDDPLYGEFQPPTRWTEIQLRHAQADYVRELVDLLLQQNPDSRIVVGGDLNDFEFGEPGEGRHTVQRVMESDTAPLTNVVPLVPAAERYTFVFEGNSQVLDHLLLDREMESLRRDQAIAHFNTDYPSAFGSNATHALRSSDHDPLVAYFCVDLTPCAGAEIQELIADLNELLAGDPRKQLEDKLEDAIANLRQALRKLANDRQGAAGELEGAAGDLEAAVKSNLLGGSQGQTFLERIAGAARLLAVEAIEESEDTGDADKIAEAKRALDQGDARVDADRFKAAVSRYKDAIAKAEGA